MHKKRGFEIISSYQDCEIELPKRQTRLSAGYDLAAAETVVLPSYWEKLLVYFLKKIGIKTFISDEEGTRNVYDDQIWNATLVPTGLKAYMQEDEYLKIVNRSSGSYRHFTSLPNGIGIIDADYYGNPNNEGHIYVQLINYGIKSRTIKKGERIAQAIFTKYLLMDNDQASQDIRVGGFGSSDQENVQENGVE